MIWRAHKKKNIEKKRIKKKKRKRETNYRQLAFEFRERRPDFKVRVVPLVNCALGGGIKETAKEMENIFETNDLCKKVVAGMQKTVLMDSETII